jgi:hypothetical protein
MSLLSEKYKQDSLGLVTSELAGTRAFEVLSVVDVSLGKENVGPESFTSVELALNGSSFAVEELAPNWKTPEEPAGGTPKLNVGIEGFATFGASLFFALLFSGEVTQLGGISNFVNEENDVVFLIVSRHLWY